MIINSINSIKSNFRINNTNFKNTYKTNNNNSGDVFFKGNFFAEPKPLTKEISDEIKQHGEVFLSEIDNNSDFDEAVKNYTESINKTISKDMISTLVFRHRFGNHTCFKYLYKINRTESIDDKRELCTQAVNATNKIVDTDNALADIKARNNDDTYYNLNDIFTLVMDNEKENITNKNLKINIKGDENIGTYNIGNFIFENHSLISTLIGTMISESPNDSTINLSFKKAKENGSEVLFLEAENKDIKELSNEDFICEIQRELSGMNHDMLQIKKDNGIKIKTPINVMYF